jgi:hypothetical protein
MSGSGGGGGNTNDWRPASTISNAVGGEAGGAGDGGPQVGSNPCLFTEVTNLASPNITVVNTLTVGSVLTVVLQNAPLRVVAMAGAATAGSITSARLPDIIQCLRSGQRYEARVTQINGGAVTVEIYPA